MSKKKDPSEVKLNAALRSNELTRKRLLKRIPAKLGWLRRVATEYADLQEKILKLEHAIWREQPTDDGTSFIFVFTDMAKSMPYRSRQLLVGQHKAMVSYRDILVKRLIAFKTNIFVPKK